MNEDFAAAMRRALQHVRTQDVMAATGVIQAALAGHSPAEGGRPRAAVDITPQQHRVPEQSLKDNVSSCWNWFRPEDQRPGAGEPAILSGLTRAIAGEFGLEPEKIFIAGFSAGGAMTAVMLATYPELYAAGCIHSGLAYRSADDVVSALAAMRGESDRRGVAATALPASRSRKIIFHGTRDAIVHPSNADRIFAAAHAGTPDTQHHVEHVSGGCGGSYIRSAATTPGESITEYWLIERLGHAWSGGRNGGSYTDPGGPDASAEMIRFFLDRT